jgi:galactokinase
MAFESKSLVQFSAAAASLGALLWLRSRQCSSLSLRDLLSPNIAARLASQGLAQDIAVEKAEMFRAAAQILLENGVGMDVNVRAFYVPGRIEVVGKHTDYAGGRSLLCATSKAFCVVTADRDDSVSRIFTAEPGIADNSVTLEMTPDLEPKQGHWSNYPATTIRRLVRNFGPGLKGVDMSISCDIPPASGMSTSSAMICAVFLAIDARNNIQALPKFKKNIPTKERLYDYLGFCENGQNCGDLLGDKGVGTFGGSEDHTAIMSCTNGNLNMFSYCNTRFEGSFPIPSGVTFVVGVSGAIAEKTGARMADYNNAFLRSKAAAEAWCELTGNNGKLQLTNLANVVQLHRARKGEQGDEAQLKELLGEFSDVARVEKTTAAAAGPFTAASLTERFLQFYEESEVIVPQVAKAFASADYKAMGVLVDRSQELTDTHLDNLVPETRFLPGKARELGALAASAFGAGFGGSVWALVETDKVAAFQAAWKQAYVAQFPQVKDACSFFAMPPGPGAFQVK